ncbi:fused response regulator/phosphatase [Bryobacterales bacterium F-183]|nr:fused response regulator/phosphatase [Bryobacterales bacterium F-183]
MIGQPLAFDAKIVDIVAESLGHNIRAEPADFLKYIAGLFPAATRPTRSIEIANMRVLVCDDQADVVEALRLLLKGAGYRIETADSPATLVGKLDDGKYDIVLMDMNYSRDTTSGAEGLELVSAVRARAGKVPIVVMTAWSSVDLAVEAMQRGASDFIQKPWDNHKLLGVVERQISKSARNAYSELEIARTVQQGLFPSRGGKSDGIEFEGLCVPAREIGGDYYDFLQLEGGRQALILADVSGKGVPAALLMANLQALFRTQTAGDLKTILRNVNSHFYRSTPPAHFATAFFAIYDPAARRLQYANCGHPPAMLFGRDGASCRKLDTTATVLGIMDGFETDVETVDVQEGDSLLMFTDGLTEAGIEDGEEFGEERIEEVLRRHLHLPVSELVAGVARAAEEYAKGQHADDMTLVAMRVVPKMGI